MSVSSIPQMTGSVWTRRAWPPPADADTRAIGTREHLQSRWLMIKSKGKNVRTEGLRGGE